MLLQRGLRVFADCRCGPTGITVCSRNECIRQGNNYCQEPLKMDRKWHLGLGLVGLAVTMTAATLPAIAQQQQPQSKPNILFIMGDDIGWMQPHIYHRGLM